MKPQDDGFQRLLINTGALRNSKNRVLQHIVVTLATYGLQRNTVARLLDIPTPILNPSC